MNASFLTSSRFATILLAAGACALVVVLLDVRGFPQVFDHLSTDDAMRLVQIRDLLAGQGWFDLVQHRLDAPNTVPMHWSRLVDLPLAALIAFFSLFMSQEHAEALTLTLWPPLLVVPVLLLLMRCIRILSGDEVRQLVLVLTLTTAGIMSLYFRPGAIDHHNIQIALVLGMLAGLVGMGISRWYAVLAAGAAALSLAVGPETTPLVAAGCLGTVMFWLFSPSIAASSHTRIFGLVFAGATLLLFGITVAPAAYRTVWCDALSLPQLVVALVGGLGLFALTLLPLRNRLSKLAALGVLGAATLLAGYAVAPQCFAAPLGALPPHVKTLWLNNVTEAKNIRQMTSADAALVMSVYVLPLFAFLCTLYLLGRSTFEQRIRWVQFLLLFLAAYAITLWQIRGTMTTSVLALLPVAAVTRHLGKAQYSGSWDWMTPRSLIFILTINGITFLGFGQFLEPLLHTPQETAALEKEKILSDRCQQQASYLPLNALPRANIANTIDTGSYLLLWTPHSVLVAPYHRQLRGLSDGMNVLSIPPDEAEKIVRERNISHVVWCQNDGQNWVYSYYTRNGLLENLEKGHVPSWLEKVPVEGTPFQVYRVLPAS